MSTKDRTRRRTPAGRTGRPTRPSSPLRRVELGCDHGWVRDPMATAGTWIWCDACGDWARVQRVLE